LKKVFVGALGLLVVVLGLSALSAPVTQAAPANIYAIGCEFLAGSIDGDADDATQPADFAAACGGDGITPAESALIEGELGDGDGSWDAGELDSVEFDANQLRDGVAASVAPPTPNGLLLFILVNDDDDVTIEPGLLGPDAACASLIGSPVNDADCDGNGTAGDGAVIHAVGDATGVGGSIEAGESASVSVTQNGVELTIDLDVVGTPDEITVTALKEAVQTLSEAESCDDIAITDGLDANEDSDKVLLVATVTDADGTDLTRVSVNFESDDTDLLDIAQDARPVGDDGTVAQSVDTSTGSTVDDDGTIVAAAVFCGQDDTGTATVTASFSDTQDEEATVEVDVVGEPASVALTASPAAIACDGSQTSTVTATVTDADGNNVAGLTDVNFSVVALGTANPINAETVAGVASSVITPLSGADAGVTVVVSSGSAQASIRIDCLETLLTPAPPAGPTPTPGTGIAGPDTGNGGYLGQDSSSGFPMWTLVALALGSVALVGGGLVARRAGR
jgi:hypothetical protein